MRLRTVISIPSEVCRRAATLYAARLREAGIVSAVRQAAPDVELAEEEQLLCVEWNANTGEVEDPEDEEPADEGDVSLCIIEHYERTLRMLASNEEAAAAFVSQASGPAAAHASAKPLPNGRGSGRERSLA